MNYGAMLAQKIIDDKYKIQKYGVLVIVLLLVLCCIFYFLSYFLVAKLVFILLFIFSDIYISMKRAKASSDKMKELSNIDNKLKASRYVYGGFLHDVIYYPILLFLVFTLI